MTPHTAERTLAWLMYVLGGMAALAVFAIVMPTAWMAEIAEWLGVGPFPYSTLTEYLTRSLSAIYAALGAQTIYIARNVRRYLDLIVVIGWLTVGLGVALTAIDFAIGMPASWSWSEGPPTVLVGGVLIWLAKRAGTGAKETEESNR